MFVPKHKKPITRQLHHLENKFSSVETLKVQILKELKDEFPDDPTVDVGYYDGRQSSKIWLVSSEDLNHMYRSCKSNEVSLWVEYRNEEESEEEDNEICSARKKPLNGKV